MEKTILNSIMKRAEGLGVPVEDLIIGELSDSGFDLPDFIASMIITFARTFDCSAKAVIGILLTHWLSQANAVFRFFGPEGLHVSPFVFDEEGAIIEGDQLKGILSAKYEELIISDNELMSKAMKHNRETREKLKAFGEEESCAGCSAEAECGKVH